MQLVNFNHKITENFVYATFLGNITKLKPIESFELSFERLGGGGVYMPEESGQHGSVWKFPVFVSSQILELVIYNTCLECGGLMKKDMALDNTLTNSDDFGNDAGQQGTTMSKNGHPNIITVHKCVDCGHSHT